MYWKYMELQIKKINNNNANNNNHNRSITYNSKWFI